MGRNSLAEYWQPLKEKKKLNSWKNSRASDVEILIVTKQFVAMVRTRIKILHNRIAYPSILIKSNPNLILESML